MGRDTS